MDNNWYFGSPYVRTGTSLNPITSDAKFNDDVNCYFGTDQDAVIVYASASDEWQLGTAAKSGATSGVPIDFATGACVTGVSGAISVHSGDGQGITGTMAFYSGDGSGAGQTGNVSVYSGDNSGTDVTGNVSLFSGAQTNTGDYDSGDVLVYSGATTTDGNTGDVIARTGAAGAGAGDAGSFIVQTHGTNERMRVNGSGVVGIGDWSGTSLSEWNTTFSAMHVGGNATLSAQTAQGAGGDLFLAQNAYRSQTGWKRISGDEVSLYNALSGRHIFWVAGSGAADSTISWLSGLELDNNRTAFFGGQTSSHSLAGAGDVICNAFEANTDSFIDGSLTVAGTVGAFNVTIDSYLTLDSSGTLYGMFVGAGTLDLYLSPHAGGSEIVSNLTSNNAALWGNSTRGYLLNCTSNGTTTITKVGHGLTPPTGALVHVFDCSTAADKGYYRAVSYTADTIVVDHALSGSDSDVDLKIWEDVIGMFATDGSNGQMISSWSAQNKPLQLGGTTLSATGHSLTAPDVLFAGKIEVDGLSYFDDDIELLDTKAIVTGTAVDDYFALEAYDTAGSARVEAIRIANNAAAAAKIGFFAATPVTQRLKADYNNWAALGDVVNALVALGLFDQA